MTRARRTDKGSEASAAALGPLAFMTARVARGAKQAGRLEPHATMPGLFAVPQNGMQFF